MEVDEELTRRFEDQRAQLESKTKEAVAALKEEAKEAPKDYSLTGKAYDFAAYVTDKSRIAKVPTGYANIDAALNGGLCARVYVVGGETSTGKTTFVWNVCENVARSGSREVLFFSLEMSAYELIARSISRRTFEAASRQGVNAHLYPLTEDEVLYSLPKVSPERYGLYAEALDEISRNEGKHLHVIEGRRDIDQIEAFVMRWINEHPGAEPPLVAIDYVQMIAPTPDRELITSAPTDERSKPIKDEYGNITYHTVITGTERKTPREQVDYITQELVFMKREYHTPIIVISSFNRQNSGSLEVDMSALKESGTIEYSADCVMLLKYRFTDEQVAGVYASKRKKKSNGEPMEAAQFEREANIKKLLREKAKQYPRDMEITLPKNRGGAKGIDTGLQYFAAYNTYRTRPGSAAIASSADEARKAWTAYKDK